MLIDEMYRLIDKFKIVSSFCSIGSYGGRLYEREIKCCLYKCCEYERYKIPIRE